MKTMNLFSMILTLVLVTSVSFAQQKIDLNLIVETDIITQDNIAETCRFENQAEGTSILDYTTMVNIGDEIKWKVYEAEGNTAKVKLEKFKHERGTKFFQKDSIPASFGRIKANVETGAPNDEEKYILVIRVKKSGGEWIEYAIDPKLKMN